MLSGLVRVATSQVTFVDTTDLNELSKAGLNVLGGDSKAASMVVDNCLLQIPHLRSRASGSPLANKEGFSLEKRVFQSTPTKKWGRAELPGVSL